MQKNQEKFKNLLNKKEERPQKFTVQRPNPKQAAETFGEMRHFSLVSVKNRNYFLMEGGGREPKSTIKFKSTILNFLEFKISCTIS